MAKAISVRLDDEAERALRLLQSARLSRSEAIRSSLLASAERMRRRSQPAAEVAALEADDDDRCEMRAVASLMESRRVAGDRTRVLVEQLGAVDAHRLGRRVGRLTAEEMWSVDDALVVVLGLD